jgi:hypothetical protein
MGDKPESGIDARHGVRAAVGTDRHTASPRAATPPAHSPLETRAATDVA